MVEKEAEYDKQMKEAQTKNIVSIRWDWSHNKKRIGYFNIPREDNVKTFRKSEQEQDICVYQHHTDNNLIY